MNRYRNYWIYSAGLFIAWVIALSIAETIRGSQGAQPYFLVFGGYCLGWVSTTIARYIYPPPKNWEVNRSQS